MGKDWSRMSTDPGQFYAINFRSDEFQRDMRYIYDLRVWVKKGYYGL